MSARLLTLLKHDVRLQFRYGIYYAYIFVLAFYIIMLWQFGSFIPNWAPGLIIFTDPAVLGFFFIGALMMLEKAENTRTALSITPISAADYYWSKSISLTTVAIIAAFIIAFFLPHTTNHLILGLTVVLTSLQFLGIGMFAALRFKTVTGYLIGAAGYLIPLIAPAYFAFWTEMPIWAMIWPPAAQFRLTLIATGVVENSVAELIALLISSAVGTCIGIAIGMAALKSEMGRK